MEHRWDVPCKWKSKRSCVYMGQGRAAKSLLDISPTKIRNEGSARAMAWCPWKPDLLATGSSSPDGKLGSGTHLQYQTTITNLNTQSPSALPSILFTDHRIVKNSWAHRVLRSLIPPSRSNRRNSMGLPTLPITTVQTDLTNSIAVHEYPSCKRLLTLSQALASAVTHSFISPNGEHVFTVCPREEAIKMWQVWARRLPFPNLLSDEEIKKFVVFEWIVSNF